MLKKTFISLLTILILVFALFGVVQAGTITPPVGTPTAQFYTLSDIYNFITSNTVATEGGHSFVFSDSLTGTGRTLTEIYNALAGLITPDKVKLGTTYLGVTGTLKSTLSGTNLTTCYDDDGNVIACNDAHFPGQDGDTVSKLAGCTPSYTQGTYTVIDNCDNLEWQRYGHGSSNGYTPPTQVSNCYTNGIYVTGGFCTYPWQDALKYCADSTLGGHSDWRLPNIKELVSIADYSVNNPTIDTTKFSNIGDEYVSSTSYGPYTPDVWSILSFDGMPHYCDKHAGCNVMCVRQY